MFSLNHKVKNTRFRNKLKGIIMGNFYFATYHRDYLFPRVYYHNFKAKFMLLKNFKKFI